MSTYTFSGTDTYSISDVKAVMQNTYEDIIGFANRQLIEYGRAESWIEDLTYILNKKAAKSFELQFYNSQNQWLKGYRYEVTISGHISSNDKSGGINYFDIPVGTKIRLFVDLDRTGANYTLVVDELIGKRGWGSNGSAMQGTASHERNYISNNLKLNRSLIIK